MKQISSSMQLTRAADYAVRVMIYFASRAEGERFLLPKLAAATSVPKSFLSKVLQALVRADLIASWRGQSGGFELLERGRNSSVREVIEAVDGPIYLNVCMISGDACSRQSWCPGHPVWEKAQQAMIDVLNAALIADLAKTANDTLNAAVAGNAVPIQIKPLI
jgi:Rrf2 family protein